MSTRPYYPLNPHRHQRQQPEAPLQPTNDQSHNNNSDINKVTLTQKILKVCAVSFLVALLRLVTSFVWQRVFFQKLYGLIHNLDMSDIAAVEDFVILEFANLFFQSVLLVVAYTYVRLGNVVICFGLFHWSQHVLVAGVARQIATVEEWLPLLLLETALESLQWTLVAFALIVAFAGLKPKKD